MQVTRHPASRGLTWLRAGIQIMARQPVALLLLTFIQFFVLLIPLALLPMIGSGIMTALMPVMYLGLMTAISATEKGERPTPMHLFEPFRAESNGVWKQLMLFGLISGVFMLAALMLARMIIPPPELGPGAAQLSQDEIAQKALGHLYSMGLVALFGIPVQMASWFSPMFIAWHDQGIGKAIFFSIVAVWRNKWAFLTLFAGWTAIILLVTLALGLLFRLMGFPVTAINALMLPMLLVFMASAYCTFWVTYRDIIH